MVLASIFRDPKVETGMSGEAINPERAYMVTATNLPVAESDTDAVSSAAPGISVQGTDGWFTCGPQGMPGTDKPNMDTVPAMALLSAKKPLKRNVTWQYEGPVLADFGHQLSRTYECPDLFQLDGKTVAIGALMHYRDKQGRFQQVRWYVGDLKDTADGPRLQGQGGTAIGAISVPATTRRRKLSRRRASYCVRLVYRLSRDACGKAVHR